jgi:surface antigen
MAMAGGLRMIALALSALALAACGRAVPPAAAPRLEAPPTGSGATTPPEAAVPRAGDSLAGTMAGGYLGARLGPAFDDTARRRAAEAERRALANDAPESWSDPDARASGEVRPLRDFTDAAGRLCREYQHRISIAGKRDVGSGIACRGSDGSWALVGG